MTAASKSPFIEAPTASDRPRPRHRAEAAPSTGPPEPATLRVVKKLSPNQRGAVALTQQYGDALVCVRHRQDAAGAFRYTTVELLVQCRAIAARNNHSVGVRIDFRETALRAKIRADGGAWDPRHKLWTVSRRVAAELGLQHRIVMSY